MEPTRKKILKVNGTFLFVAGTVMTVFVLLGRYRSIGVFKILHENEIASIGFFEAFLLAAISGLFLRHAASRENVSKFNLLAALVHAALAFTNILNWNFYEVVDGVIPGTIATIIHFVFIGLECWAGFSKKN